MDISISSQEQIMYDFGAKIRVFGVGGGGGNAVQTMIDTGLSGVDFITANTDMQALVKSTAAKKIQLGKALTRGLGAGAKPDVGRAAAEESLEEIQAAIGDADMIFITAGMGGGTGTGAAPVIAKTAKEKGVLTVGVVTKPFQFEGDRRMRTAEDGILALAEEVDSLIVVPNSRLLNCGAKNAKMIDMLKKADEVLCSAVRGITDLIKSPGFINADFADIKTVMNDRGMALMGSASASGEQRAMNAAKAAISSPLLEDISIPTAKGVIVNVTANADITMEEYSEAVGHITNYVASDTIIVAAMAIDPEAGDALTVTVIATGLEQNPNASLEPALTQPMRNQMNQQLNQQQHGNIPFSGQPKRTPYPNNMHQQQQQQHPQHHNQQANYYNTMNSLPGNNNMQHGMNANDTKVPTYLRNQQNKMRTHTPGGADYVFPDEETELPAFIRKQAN